MATDPKAVAAEVQKALVEFSKVEPWIATVLPMVVPAAAPVMPIVNEFAPLILAAAARALGDIATNNGGDIPAAVIEFLQHITKGQPNSPILSAPSGGITAG